MSSCIDVIFDMAKTVTDVNTEITINMIEPKMNYEYVCIKPNLTYDHFYNSLKTKWEKIVNDHTKKPDKCSSNIQSILLLREIASNLNLNNNTDVKSIRQSIQNIKPEQLESFAHNKLVDTALKMITSASNDSFVVDKDMIKTMKSAAMILSENCQCQIIEIFSYVMGRYKTKYSQKLVGKTRDEMVKIITDDYQYVKDTIIHYGSGFDHGQQFFKQRVGIKGGASILNFSIENELNRLIPDEIGSMKGFFIKVIAQYFNNLHPIIWGQIFKGYVTNLFKDLPSTQDELFSFASKYLLLNSGPFILKILQGIRPILSDELSAKYNLTKLTYPLLEPDQIEIILKQILIDYDMIRITYNKSASVGHVCIGYDVRKPEEKFVVKIIKPLAIAQSCWEYSVLSDLFPKGSCEDCFVKNTLRANGAEMNVGNEIENLKKSNASYTTDYRSEFGIDIDANLTTIANKDGIIKKGTWFALAMTLAPGIPVADLVENKLLEKDTKFRANLHRCLDLLVAKFFYVLVSQGFYHGDLHSGNIFYSFRTKQLTMIDFGAMGEIDIYKNDETTKKLLQIIIMSTKYNFDGLFDVLTDILNDRCKNDPSGSIDKTNEEYVEFKKLLIEHRIKNTLNREKDRQLSEKTLNYYFKGQRIEDEKHQDTLESVVDEIRCKDNDEMSIYDALERKAEHPETKETLIENKDDLPVNTEIIGKSESITFAGVMGKIIQFYAKSGINVAVKFSELNELQKAYALLLGVLVKTGYNSSRMEKAITTGIMRWQLLPKLFNVSTALGIYSMNSEETAKIDDTIDRIQKTRKELMKKKFGKI
jgi:hypothetical protein